MVKGSHTLCVEAMAAVGGGEQRAGDGGNGVKTMVRRRGCRPNPPETRGVHQELRTRRIQQDHITQVFRNKQAEARGGGGRARPWGREGNHRAEAPSCRRGNPPQPNVCSEVDFRASHSPGQPTRTRRGAHTCGGSHASRVDSQQPADAAYVRPTPRDPVAASGGPPLLGRLRRFSYASRCFRFENVEPLVSTYLKKIGATGGKGSRAGPATLWRLQKRMPIASVSVMPHFVARKSTESGLRMTHGMNT